MDTLTHALSGALAGRLLAGRPVRGQAPSLKPWQAVLIGTVAAAFPDLDFVLRYVSDLAYLRGHRGVTHSLLMLPLWGALIAWVMAAILNLPERRRGAAPNVSWRHCYLVACVAIFVHIAGDLITQFGTMILAPLSDRRFGFGTTFIIDLGVSGILLAGLLASAVWRSSRVPASLAALALLAWIGNSAVARSDAIDAARAYAEREGIAVVALDAAPRPASPYNWTAIVFDGRNYHYAHLNTRRLEPLVATADDHFIRRFSAPYQPVALARWHTAARFGDEAAAGLARRVWEAEEFEFFRWFAMFPVLDHVAQPGDPNGTCASFRDLRFETPGRPVIPFRFGLCNGGSGWRMFERVAGGLRWMTE
ncbi:MAG: metal-dependent hydrolase [Rhodocyclaceae bacterium]|nr:metal-dependent hydrolase [Rhodocyclaceae bacterium]